MSYQVEEYVREDGSCPYAKWFNHLPAQHAAKVVTAKVRMQQGNLSNVKWFRGIGEYKIDFGPGFRIYIGKDGEHLIILLAGGTKKTQQGDINKALSLWDEYKTRKAKMRNRKE